MASATQLKALLKSHLEGDDERFCSVAMQVAAHEARVGHGKLALELRHLIDRAKETRGLPDQKQNSPVPIARPRGELAELLALEYPKTRLVDMVLSDALATQLERVIREQRKARDILAHGLAPRRKLMLIGPPGTGKTMTASVLASELGLPLLRVRLDGLITKFMGETAAKLRQIFESTTKTRGVYFFDEFDAIGSERGLSNDVGEIRRVLNSFLQMIEQDESNSLIVAATNHSQILDQALFRRFDDVLQYKLPSAGDIEQMLKSRLRRVCDKDTAWKTLASEYAGLSYADVAKAANESLKSLLIEGREHLLADDIRQALQERQEVSKRTSGRE